MKQILILTAMGLLTACASTTKTDLARQPQQVIGQVDSEAEKKALLKSFSSDAASSSMQINEVLFTDKISQKTANDYFPAIKSSFIKKANDPKSKLYKYLRIESLSMTDFRNPSGISFPIKSEDIKIFGTSGHHVDQRETCSIDEKTNKLVCSNGWSEDDVLVGVKRQSCHNAGCDTDTVLFVINVTREPETTLGSVLDDRNQKDFKVISPSYVSVSVDSPYRLDIPYTKDYQ